MDPLLLCPDILVALVVGDGCCGRHLPFRIVGCGAENTCVVGQGTHPLGLQSTLPGTKTVVRRLSVKRVRFERWSLRKVFNCSPELLEDR